MQIGRKYLQGHGRELPKTVAKTSLFVKDIFEKSGQGETYEFDPASLVYLRPMEAAEEEEKKAAPEEERAREYVLREKETMKLITKEEKIREFYTHIIQESVLPSAQEMLKEKSARKQLLVQLEILLKECREIEHRTEHFAGQQGIGQVWDSFREELRVLEQQTESWNHAGGREEGYLRKQIKEKVEHLFTYRNILENQERQQQQMSYGENQTDIVLNRILHKVQNQILELTEEELTELKQELLKQELLKQELLEQEVLKQETESVHARTILEQIRKICLEELFETTIKKEENRPILIEEKLPQPEMTDKNSQTTWNTKQVQQVTEEIDKIVQKILDVQIETQSKERQESNYEFQRTETGQLPTELLTELQAEIGTETTWVQQDILQKVYHQLLELTEEERTELKQELLKQQVLKQKTESVRVETVLDQIRKVCLEDIFETTIKKENNSDAGNDRKEEKRPILIEEELPQPEMTYKNSQTTWNTEQVQQVTEEIDKIVQKILDVQIETHSKEQLFQRIETEQLPTKLLTELQAEIGTETTWVQQETIQKMYHQILELTEEDRTELKQELLKQELLEQQMLKQETTYEQNIAEFVKRYQTEKELSETESVQAETILNQIRVFCLEEVFEKTVKEENRSILVETELPQREMTDKNNQTTWNSEQIQQVTEEIDKVVQKILDVQIETQSKEQLFQRIEAGQLPTELLTELQAEIGTETTWVQQETLQKVYHLLLELTEEERTELKQEVLKQEKTYEQNIAEFVERYRTEKENVAAKELSETDSIRVETVLDQIRILCLEELFEKEIKKENNSGAGNDRKEEKRPISIEEKLPQSEMTYKNSQTTWNIEQVQQATEEIDKIVQKILDVQIEAESKEQLFQRIEAGQLPTELLTELQAEIGTETTWVQQETLQKVYRLLLELTEEERTELKQEVLKQEKTYEQNVSEFVERYRTEKENVAAKELSETDSIRVETVLDQIRKVCLEEVFETTIKEENHPILIEELPQPEMTDKNNQTTWNSEQIQQVTEEIDKVVQKIFNVQIEAQSKEQLFQRIETEQLTTKLLTKLQAEIGTETTWVQQETIKKMYHQILELTEEERTELKQELLKQELLKQEVLRQETTYEQNVTEFVKRYQTEKELSETESVVHDKTILDQIRKVCLEEVFEKTVRKEINSEENHGLENDRKEELLQPEITYKNSQTAWNTTQVQQVTEEIDKIVRMVLDVQTEAESKGQPFPKIGAGRLPAELLTELQAEIGTETTWVQHRTEQNVENLLWNLTEETTYEQIQQLTAHPQIQELMEKRELQTPKESGQSDERLQYYQNHAEKVEKLREEQQQQFRMLQETTQQQAEQLVKIENWQQEIKERLLEQEQAQPLKNQDEKTLRKFQEQLRLERLRRGLI